MVKIEVRKALSLDGAFFFAPKGNVTVFLRRGGLLEGQSSVWYDNGKLYLQCSLFRLWYDKNTIPFLLLKGDGANAEME